MWAALAVVGWVALVGALAWGADQRFRRKVAEDRLRVRERIAAERDWRDAEPVLLRFPSGERRSI